MQVMIRGRKKKKTIEKKSLYIPCKIDSFLEKKTRYTYICILNKNKTKMADFLWLVPAGWVRDKQETEIYTKFTQLCVTCPVLLRPQCAAILVWFGFGFPDYIINCWAGHSRYSHNYTGHLRQTIRLPISLLLLYPLQLYFYFSALEFFKAIFNCTRKRAAFLYYYLIILSNSWIKRKK